MCWINSIKFFTIFALIFLLFPACRSWSKTLTGTSEPATSETDVLKSEIPFAATEPEVFQTQIVVSVGGQEQITRTARNGAKRRSDFNFGRPDQVTYLQTDKNYLIFPAKKIYAETAQTAGSAVFSDNWQDFLTSELLNAKSEATFEKLETIENITKYRVRLDGKAASEILIFVDEKVGLPVRQEFYSINGAERVLTYTMEMKNLKMETDENLFVVPDGFRRVSLEDLRKELNKNE